ncbi:MAG: Rrf2 family transcriptional regulator [Saprospiraceae bacterium]|nr:Rrf2 family transcriptional regulator [Saprospiraceae bacterium]
MKVLSKTSEYGLRALLFMVGKRQEQEYINIREMSEQLDISFHFLTKILQNLTQAGMLTSYRGPSGGVAFNVSPDNILLIDVIRLLEGDDFFEKCLLGLPGCGEKAPCPMHRFWGEIRGALRQEFESTTLAQMGESVLKSRLRLVP